VTPGDTRVTPTGWSSDPLPLVQVAQRVTDVERATAFYADLLGQGPSAALDPPGLVFFVLPGGVRLLLERGVPASLLYLGVGDLEATVARLRSSGVVVRKPPHHVFAHTDDTLGPAGTTESMAFVEDSEGNVIGLVGRRPGASLGSAT